MKKLLKISAVILFMSFIISPVNGQWKKLAKKDLSAWEQLNGTAPFKLEKGVVIGTTVLNSPTHFFVQKKNTVILSLNSTPGSIRR